MTRLTGIGVNYSPLYLSPLLLLFTCQYVRREKRGGGNGVLGAVNGVGGADAGLAVGVRDLAGGKIARQKEAFPPERRGRPGGLGRCRGVACPWDGCGLPVIGRGGAATMRRPAARARP